MMIYFMMLLWQRSSKWTVSVTFRRKEQKYEKYLFVAVVFTRAGVTVNNVSFQIIRRYIVIIWAIIFSFLWILPYPN